MPAAVEFRAVSRHFGPASAPVKAVDAVDLTIAEGAFFAMLGPSGSGKTTCLRLISGFESPTVGEIRIFGQDVSATPPHLRNVNTVFQDYALFPHMDVERNLAFGIQHLPAAQRKQRVREVLDLVGLAGAEKRFPHELSGGQQQRVALARALAPSPQLLLLDEPFSNLDVDLRERLAHEVREILKAAGATALFVTHDQLEAFAIGDMIGVMHEGLLHQWDDAYTLYHRPARRFVANFIGHGVFTPATISTLNGQTLVQTPLGDLNDVAECPVPSAFEGGQCDVLLRADDIVHDDDAPTKAEILRKSFRGSEFLYTLRLAHGQVVMALVPSHHDHKVGEWIGIKAQVDHVVTFQREG